MTFGEKVKSLRTTKNMSQAQLAQELGVALRTVSGWENQNRYPKKHDLYQKLSDILGCDISYLMSEEDSFITEAAEQFGMKTLVSEKAEMDSMVELICRSFS